MSFHHGKAVHVLCTGDSLLTRPDSKELNIIIEKIKQKGLKITSEEGVNIFLGIHIKKKDIGTIHLTQPSLIKSTFNDLRFTNATTMTETMPAPLTVILCRHTA